MTSTDTTVDRLAGVGRRHAPIVVAGIVAAYFTAFFVALPALLWTLGGRLDVLLALPHWRDSAWSMVGTVVGALGLGWMLWAMVALRVVGGGWPISHLPPVRLVTSGPYRWTRHPIYLGYTVAFAGVAVAAGSPGRLLAAGLLALGATGYVAGIEMRQLQALRTAAHEEYRPRISGLARLALPVWRVSRGPVERLANRTVLLRVGPTVWSTFGAVLSLGAGVGLVLVTLRLTSDGMSRAAVLTFVGISAAAMAIGARVAWLVGTAPRIGLRRAMRTVGTVSWGGYVGLLVAMVLFSAVYPADLLWLSDRAVPPMLVSSAIGRLGCLSYGCCFGLPWKDGITYHDADSKVVRLLGDAGRVPRLPVQLVSGALTAAAAVMAGLVSLFPAPAGTLTGTAALLYGFFRFCADSLRDGSFDIPGLPGWSVGQLASGAVAGGGLLLLYTVDGPSSWPRSVFSVDWSQLPSLLPLIVGLTIAAFVALGFHWRHIGQW